MSTPCREIARRDEKIFSLLRALVRINTEHAAPAPGAPYGEGCARALEYALGECERLGFATHRLGEKIGWAEVGARGPLAAFPVHLDVVPAGDGWSHDPYAAEVIDGVLYGRGCMDNKIGAAILTVLLAEYAGQDLPCRLRIVFGTDEETGMSDLREYVGAGEELPSMGFVPDAAFPVVRGEKARLHLRISCEVGVSGLLVRGGSMANMVPAEAHATLPRLGPDAGRLPEVERLLCADLTGEALGIDAPDEVFGHTSMNLGTLSVEAGRLVAELDVRFGTALLAGDVIARIRAALGSGWEVEVVQEKPIHLVSEDDPCVQALLDAYERVYASFMPALVAFGPKLPGTHSGAHGVDEHVRLEDVSRAADIYHEAVRNIIELAASLED